MNTYSLTRKERDKQLRKTDLLCAAEHLFALKGYERATMQEIAIEAQYATGTAYLYFKDKESLYFSLLEEKISDMMSAIKKKTSGAKDAREEINIFIYESLVFFANNQDFFHIFVSETTKFRWAIDSKINSSESMLGHMSYLADIIRRAQRQNVVRSDFKAEYVADIFTAILSAVIVGLLKARPGLSGELKNTSDHIFDLFINGVRA